ncbi:hypothetical protein [Streptomyces sp. NPDC094032]
MVPGQFGGVGGGLQGLGDREMGAGAAGRVEAGDQFLAEEVCANR